MKNSSIADSVFKVKLNYEKLQNKTEELFFDCLAQEKDVEYFTEKLKEIWGSIDHSFVKGKIEEYSEVIYVNTNGKNDRLVKNEGDLLGLVPATVLISTEKFFQRIKKKEYQKSINYVLTLNEENKDIAKEEYIKLKLANYTNNTVVYKAHTPGGHNRMVSPSVYNSMIYNTNLTRSIWNETMSDADKADANFFIIPYHSFSCSECLPYQERILTRNEVIRIAGRAEEQVGDILHPNCKCELTIWDRNEPIPRSLLTKEEKEEAAIIRQKVNGLTLEKERLKTKMKIAEKNNLMDEFDKYNQKRNKINSKIREYKNMLPTNELKKQVVAINR